MPVCDDRRRDEHDERMTIKTMPAAIPADDSPAARPAFRGGLILAIASLTIFTVGLGQTHGVSVFVDPLIEQFGWSRSLVSTMFSLATLISAIPIVLVGRQIDRVGARKVMTIEAVCFGLSLIGLSRINSLLAFLVGLTLLRSFGPGVLMLASRTIVPQWFSRRRGRAFGIIGVAGALNLAIVPRANEALIGWLGWRDAWAVGGLIVLLVLTPLIAVLVRGKPEDVGEFPDGLPPETPAVATLAESTGSEWSLQEAMRTRAFWSLQAAGAVPAFVLTGVAFHQASMFEARGLPDSLASTGFAVESAVALPITLCAGWLVDRYATRYVLAVAHLIVAIALGIVLVAGSIPAALLYLAVRGTGTALWQVSGDASWPAYFGRRHLGTIRGIAFAVSIVGAALGPVPLGVVYDLTGSYGAAVATFAAIPAVTAYFVFTARLPDKPALD
jgi:MFS family permease